MKIWHIDGELGPILSQDSPLVKEIRDWLEYLKEEDDKVMVNEVRSSTRTGRPCGDDSFISRVRGATWATTEGSIPRKAFQEINGRCPYYYVLYA